MNLYQILDVNEPQQNIALYVWITQYWTDAFLGWKPDDFDGIENIVLPHDSVWLPDTILYNSVEMVRHNSERFISVIYTTNLNGTGADAVFQYPAIYRFTCRMNIFYFPFDTQNCSLTFSSWVYDASGIEYFEFREEVTNESYVENEEWKVKSFTYEKEVIQYHCCPIPWTLLHIHLLIKRKSLYYISNLVLPTGIITFISIIGFFTPTTTSMERTEKVNLGITTLLAMSILLLMVSDQMPTTSNFVPLMGWFFLTIIVLISVGTLMTSVILNIQQQAIYGKRVPVWVKRVFCDRVAPFLRMAPRKELALLLKMEHISKGSFKRSHPVTAVSTEERCPLELNGFNSPPLRSRDRIGTINGGKHGVLKHFGTADSENENKMPLPFHTEEEEESFGEGEKVGGNRLMELEWEFLAAILDRIFLLLFGFGVSFVTIGMLMIDLIFHP